MRAANSRTKISNLKISNFTEYLTSIEQQQTQKQRQRLRLRKESCGASGSFACTELKSFQALKASVYLLYWYRSTNTDFEEFLDSAGLMDKTGTQSLSLLALLVQKYKY